MLANQCEAQPIQLTIEVVIHQGELHRAQLSVDAVEEAQAFLKSEIASEIGGQAEQTRREMQSKRAQQRRR